MERKRLSCSTGLEKSGGFPLSASERFLKDSATGTFSAARDDETPLSPRRHEINPRRDKNGLKAALCPRGPFLSEVSFAFLFLGKYNLGPLGWLGFHPRSHWAGSAVNALSVGLQTYF